MKIIMTETTTFEGNKYTKDEVYEVPTQSAFALGDSCKHLSAPEVNKMVSSAPKTKIYKGK